MINKSLENLLGKWKEEIPRENYSSSIQIRTYELYSKKIDDYDVDDIRFMIGQRQGLKYLVPMAISLLEEDILTEGLYYEGDLLSAVFHIPRDFWKKNLKLYSKVYEILLKNKEIVDNLDQDYEANRSLISNREKFLKVLIKKKKV